MAILYVLSTIHTAMYTIGSQTGYKKMVPRDRVELPTRGFSVPCSTN
jgi:hypothetical protein